MFYCLWRTYSWWCNNDAIKTFCKNFHLEHSRITSRSVGMHRAETSRKIYHTGILYLQLTFIIKTSRRKFSRFEIFPKTMMNSTFSVKILVNVIICKRVALHDNGFRDVFWISFFSLFMIIDIFACITKKQPYSYLSIFCNHRDGNWPHFLVLPVHFSYFLRSQRSYIKNEGKIRPES